MIVEESKLKGCFIIRPTVFKDSRGYFNETFNKKSFNEALGFNVDFVQDNESQSSKGVLRGLHFQKDEHAQTKLVRVIKGKVLDVVVDIRKGSETLGEQFSMILSEENKAQLYIPKGFAHGFVTLEDHTIFSYKCDEFYNKASESGIIYNDDDLNIDWVLPDTELIISEKDVSLPKFKDAVL